MPKSTQAFLQNSVHLTYRIPQLSVFFQKSLGRPKQRLHSLVLPGQRAEGNQLSNKEKREAQKAAKREMAEKWTIDKLFKEYIKTRPDNKSRAIDEGRYEKYLKPVVSNREPKDILPLDVDRLKITLLKKRSPQTVKHILNLLTWTINFGVKRNLCEGISFHIQKPTVNNQKTEDLTSEQLINLIETIETDSHPQAGPMMKMALITGMRRGELFKLKWKHLDFERGFIHIIDPISRVLRIPGTYNFKLENNPREVTVISSDGPTYECKEFEQFIKTKENTRKERGKKAPSSTSTNSQHGNWDQSIDSLPVSGRIKGLIQHGKDKTYPSRNEADQAVITALVNKGVSEVDIKSIFESYSIGEKYREHSAADKYLQHNIEKAKEMLNLSDETYKKHIST